MIQQRSLAMYILLSIVTCGIYSIYFWYMYAEDMNKVCMGDGESTQNYIIVLLLTFVTCGIYMFYFYYTLGNRLAKNAPRYSLSFEENGTTVLLWILVGSLLCGIGSFIAIHILMKNMNQIAERYNSYNYGGGAGSQFVQ